MPKFFYLFLSFFLFNRIYSQIFIPFIFIEDKPFVYDTLPQQIAEEALQLYYSGDFTKSIILYDSLTKLRPKYYQAYFNSAKCYVKNNDPNVIILLKKYIINSKEKCNCSLILKTEDFIKYQSELEKDSLISRCCNAFYSYIKKNHIKNHELLLELDLLDAKEQEILANNNETKKTDLKNNFKKFLKVIDTTDFPTRKGIGRGTSLIELFLLHADYYPEMQFTLATKLLKKSSKDYSPKMLAYIIDRSLRNRNLNQLYGTILLTDENKKTILYKFDDFEKLKKRRKKLGFQSIEEYKKNRNITK